MKHEFWIITVLMLLTTSVYGQNAADISEAQTILRAFNTSTKWKDESLQLSFKELTLGSNFSMGPQSNADIIYNGNFNTFASTGKSYVCSYTQPLAFAIECRHQPLPEPGVGWKTAFGQPINLSLWITLDEFSTVQQSKEVGLHGKIAIIKIETRDDANVREFLQNASEYFVDKYQATPEVFREESKAKPIQSPQCIRDLGVIDKKPISAISAADVSRRKQCNSESMLLILSGAGSSQKSEILGWQKANVKARIVYQLSSVPGISEAGRSRAAIDMSIDLNANNAANEFAAAMKALTEKIENRNRNKGKGDF